MREEIEAAVKSEGWSKSSMNKMVKLESFLKETARFYPHAASTHPRMHHFYLNSCDPQLEHCARLCKTSRSLTAQLYLLVRFSQYPSLRSNVTRSVSFLDPFFLVNNHLQSNYTHADNFDPFRFSQMHDGLKHQMVTTSPDFLIFGIGRQAW
jgi:hypothetical protein